MPIATAIFVLLAVSCSHQTAETAPNPAPASEGTKVEVAPTIDSGTRQRAETFDKYLNGKLSESEVAGFREGCQKAPQENIFCTSLARGEALEKRIRNRIKYPRSAPKRSVIQPYPLKISGKKVENWKKVRKAPVKPLLKSMLALSPEDLNVVKTMALKERRCPNNVALAVAATLEDFLPDRAASNEIASLYEKAADCARGSDKEQYLTRAGLLHFLRKEYKIASQYFGKAVKIREAFVSRSLYWLYRCQEALGEKEEAKKALDQLLSKYPFAFHALIAAIANNRDPGELALKANSTLSAKARSQKVAAINALIEQAEILRQCGHEGSSMMMADWAMDEAGKAEPEVRWYLAELAPAPTKIQIASDLLNRDPPQYGRSVLEMFFPKAFYPIFERHSGTLDPFILMSIARQESVFNEKAISVANAQGLMQIHPDTSIKLTEGKQVDLLEPEVSVRLGSQYLADLLKRHTQIHLALAAYNAGEEKLAVWASRYVTTEPTLFIDLLSYRETRNYVASVLRNYYWYRRVHGGASLSISKVVDPEVAKKN